MRVVYTFRVVLFISSILGVLGTQTIIAQAEQENPEPLIQNFDSLTEARINLGKTKFTPFIAPSYTPETEVLLTAGGLLSFNIQPTNPLVARSSIPFSIGYSTNGSFQANVKAYVFGKNDKLRVSGELWLKDMPDNYWGVGYNNAQSFPQGDSTSYHRKWISIYGKAMHQFRKNLFIGPILNINRTKATDLNPRMQDDLNIVLDGTLIKNTGIGFAFSYDSRDMPTNAYKGWYLDLSMIVYGTFLGGEHKFTTFEIDYRQYKSIKRKRNTLAWQVKARSASLKTPWTDLSQLGTPFDLRAYNWGRYRDKSFILGIVEYRHMFKRKKPNKKGSFDSRAGFVTWIGTGALGSYLGDLSYFIPAVGVGFRFEVQPRMNARIDFGIGEKSTGFYVSFNEAF